MSDNGSIKAEDEHVDVHDEGGDDEVRAGPFPPTFGHTLPFEPQLGAPPCKQSLLLGVCKAVITGSL